MVLIHLSCCKQNIEMPDYEPDFTNKMYKLELCKIDNLIKHLRCSK